MTKRTYKPESKCDYTVVGEDGKRTEFGSDADGAATALVGAAKKMTAEERGAASVERLGDVALQQKFIDAKLVFIATEKGILKNANAELVELYENLGRLIKEPLGGKLPFPPAEEKDGAE